MFKKTIRAVKKISFHILEDEKTKKEMRPCPQKREKKKSLLPTLCPIWTFLLAINYPLKYTVEGLNAGLRARRGKRENGVTRQPTNS